MKYCMLAALVGIAVGIIRAAWALEKIASTYDDQVYGEPTDEAEAPRLAD